MKRLRGVIFVAFFASFLFACGKKESDAMPMEVKDSSAQVTVTANSTVAQAGSITDSDAPAEMLQNNIYFREITVGEKVSGEMTLKRANGGTFSLSYTTILLNGTKYPYEMKLYDEDGVLRYHLYTVEENGEAYVYEEQNGEKRFLGARGRYYCPWVADDSEVFPEERLSEVLDNLSKLDTTADRNEYLVYWYETYGGTKMVADLGNTYLLLDDGCGVPGALLSESMVRAYRGASVLGPISVSTEDYIIGIYSTAEGTYVAYYTESEMVLKNPAGEIICTVTDDSAKWGQNQYFVRKGYGESEIDGIPLTDFFEDRIDPSPSQEDPDRAVWIRTASQDEWLSAFQYTEQMAAAPGDDMCVTYSDGDLRIWYEDVETEEWLDFGDTFRIDFDEDSAEAEGDFSLIDDGVHYMFSGKRYTEMAGARSLLLENLIVVAADDGTLDPMVFLSGMYGTFTAFRDFPYLTDYPDNLTCEYEKDREGRITAEVYYAGSYELARINYVYDRDGSYTVPEGRVCSEYAYLCGEPCGKAVHFYHPDDPNVCLVYTDSGDSTFVIYDAATQ